MENNYYLSSAEIIIFLSNMDFHQQDIRQFLEEAIPVRFEQLSPPEFEQFIVYLFEVDEFEILKEKPSGQFAGIISAQKEGVKHVIVPVLASVEEEVGNEWIEIGRQAREFLHAEEAWVITTTLFSEEAKKSAEEEGIELWDWDVLYDALCQLFFEGKTHDAYFESHPSRMELPEIASELKLKVKWEAAEGIGTEWFNLGLTITNPTDRNIYLHLQLPALIDHKRQQVMAEEWVEGEFVAGLIYAGASVRTNALFSVAKLGERPPGGKVVLTCHERLEVPATYHLEARLKGEACYIITYCYSIHSPEYYQMTLYRDHVLKKSLPGRLLVDLYYACSPFMIRLASYNRIIDFFLRWTVSRVIHIFIKDRTPKTG